MYARGMTWRVLRMWHVEVLSSVAARAEAHTFTRTSYGIAPESWAALPEAELVRRCEQLLDASYRRRNAQTAASGDPAEMWWIADAFEWLAPHEMPGEQGDVAAHVWVKANGAVADGLLARAIAELAASWRLPRPGVDAAPWRDAFSAFAINADGAGWNIVRPWAPETLALFAERLG